MLNYFGSAVLINDFSCLTSDHVSQLPHYDVASVPLSLDNIKCLCEDYVYLCMKVAASCMPFFHFLQSLLPPYLGDVNTSKLVHKPDVIPLQILPHDEQKYEDVVKILRHHVSYLEK